MNKKNNEIGLGTSISIDAVGYFYPTPIVMLKTTMEETETNTIIRLLTDDPFIKDDLLQWCYATGNKLLSFKRLDNIFSAYIKKTSRKKQEHLQKTCL